MILTGYQDPTTVFNRNTCRLYIELYTTSVHTCVYTGRIAQPLSALYWSTRLLQKRLDRYTTHKVTSRIEFVEVYILNKLSSFCCSLHFVETVFLFPSFAETAFGRRCNTLHLFQFGGEIGRRADWSVEWILYSNHIRVFCTKVEEREKKEEKIDGKEAFFLFQPL